MNDYFLLFTQHFDRDKGLDYGRLSLNTLSEGTKCIWRATSSIASKQYPESFQERGGLIPPQYRCPKLSNYTVKTQPIPLPHVKVYPKVPSNSSLVCRHKMRVNLVEIALYALDVG